MLDNTKVFELINEAVGEHTKHVKTWIKGLVTNTKRSRLPDALISDDASKSIHRWKVLDEGKGSWVLLQAN
jgi:hypothetical protein